LYTSIIDVLRCCNTDSGRIEMYWAEVQPTWAYAVGEWVGFLRKTAGSS